MTRDELIDAITEEVTGLISAIAPSFDAVVYKQVVKAIADGDPIRETIDEFIMPSVEKYVDKRLAEGE